jgi:hypothetical protein
MLRLIYPSEKSLAFGFLLISLGISGVFFLDAETTQHKVLRFISCFFFLVGLLWFHGALFVRWSRSRLPPSVQNNQGSAMWVRILVVVLWLGILPFAFLWIYHYFERARSAV